MRKYKPSRTAYKVALNILALGAYPKMSKILPPDLVDSSRKILVASKVSTSLLVNIANSKLSVLMYKAFDWMMPGQFEAFGHRKAFCEKQTRDSIKNGAKQVLVLGAGYDTLGWRLAPLYPDVTFFEIDHPATAQGKAKGIEVLGKRNNLILIAVDLAKRKLVNVLKEHESWGSNKSTVIVAEGLLMYLTPSAANELFIQCRQVTGSNSRLVFTYIPQGENGQPNAGPHTRLVLWLLKASGEPWLFSSRPEQLGSLLSKGGWNFAPELIDGPHHKGGRWFQNVKGGRWFQNDLTI